MDHQLSLLLRNLDVTIDQQVLHGVSIMAGGNDHRTGAEKERGERR